MNKIILTLLTCILVFLYYFHINYDVSIYDKGQRPSAFCEAACQTFEDQYNEVPSKNIRGTVTPDDWNFLIPEAVVVEYSLICLPEKTMKIKMYESKQLSIARSIHMSFDFDQHNEYVDGHIIMYGNGGRNNTIVHYRPDGIACTLSAGSGFISIKSEEREKELKPKILPKEDA